MSDPVCEWCGHGLHQHMSIVANEPKPCRVWWCKCTSYRLVRL